MQAMVATCTLCRSRLHSITPSMKRVLQPALMKSTGDHRTKLVVAALTLQHLTRMSWLETDVASVPHIGSLFTGQQLACSEDGQGCLAAIFMLTTHVSREEKCCMPCLLLFLVHDFFAAAGLQRILT